ncbi:hypothetical protein KJ785_00075 [Patescibacteria group bacterium]|nr:hypothetical protein [Patescibacteria group bacterium]
MSNLLSIILVAFLGVIGNITYFKYQTKKEKSKEVLKTRLTNLLLPLFITLKDDEINLEWAIKYDDPCDFDSEKPTRLFNKLIDIIKDNLYLADDELHEACLLFLNWAALSDGGQRFQDLHNSVDIDDADFEKFRCIVYCRYDKERNKYLS